MLGRSFRWMPKIFISNRRRWMQPPAADAKWQELASEHENHQVRDSNLWLLSRGRLEENEIYISKGSHRDQSARHICLKFSLRLRLSEIFLSAFQDISTIGCTQASSFKHNPSCATPSGQSSSSQSAMNTWGNPESINALIACVSESVIHVWHQEYTQIIHVAVGQRWIRSTKIVLWRMVSTPNFAHLLSSFKVAWPCKPSKTIIIYSTRVSEKWLLAWVIGNSIGMKKWVSPGRATRWGLHSGFRAGAPRLTGAPVL